MTKILLIGNNSTLSHNAPIKSRYELVRSPEVNQLESQLIATWQPEWLQYSLIHAVGQILYTHQSWVYTFDSRLNQLVFADENQQLLDLFREWLAQDSCKKIVVNSNYAKQQFVEQHQNWSKFEQLSSKIEVIYPLYPQIASKPKSWSSDDGCLDLFWVGGGENTQDDYGYRMVINLAKKFLVNQLPFKIHLVVTQNLTPETENCELWQLDNVIVHQLSTSESTSRLMAQCHFQLLTATTEHEANRYLGQMLSGFSLGIPAITTNLPLLSEFNHDQVTGYLLKLDQVKKSSLSELQDSLVEQTRQILQKFWQQPDSTSKYTNLSAGTLTQIEHDHGQQASDRLDYLYARSIKITPTVSSNPTKPLVSVVIPLYNGELYIQEAIASILQQTYDHYEIIIVDDGSTDNSYAVLKPYLDRIRYLKQDNQGVSEARNHGIRQSRGELIAFLDADDFFLSPTKLEAEVNCFNQHPALGLIHCGWCQVDPEGNKITEERCWLKVPHLNLASWITHKYVLPSALIVRRNWLDKIGGYNTYLTHSEDVDLVLRLLSLDCPATWLKEIGVAYRQHANNASAQTDKRGTSLEIVLNNFFALPNLPTTIIKQKERVFFYDLLWVAWGFYHHLDFKNMATYIQKAFAISPYLYSDTIYRCLNQFDELNQQYNGKKIDPLCLTNSPEWQRVIQLYQKAKS